MLNQFLSTVFLTHSSWNVFNPLFLIHFHLHLARVYFILLGVNANLWWIWVYVTALLFFIAEIYSALKLLAAACEGSIDFLKHCMTFSSFFDNSHRKSHRLCSVRTYQNLESSLSTRLLLSNVLCCEMPGERWGYNFYASQCLHLGSMWRKALVCLSTDAQGVGN